MDRATLGLTPAAMLRHDKTLAGASSSTYPSLDVDDGPLPKLASQGEPGASVPNAVDPVQPATGATTPASAVQAIASESPATTPATPKVDDQTGIAMGPDFEAPQTSNGPAAPPPGLPADITTEVSLAKALGMTRGAFRKWATEQSLTAYPVPKGTRGGNRYSGGEALRKFQASAQARVDAAVRSELAAVLDPSLEDPDFRLRTPS